MWVWVQGDFDRNKKYSCLFLEYVKIKGPICKNLLGRNKNYITGGTRTCAWPKPSQFHYKCTYKVLYVYKCNKLYKKKGIIFHSTRMVLVPDQFQTCPAPVSTRPSRPGVDRDLKPWLIAHSRKRGRPKEAWMKVARIDLKKCNLSGDLDMINWNGKAEFMELIQT